MNDPAARRESSEARVELHHGGRRVGLDARGSRTLAVFLASAAIALVTIGMSASADGSTGIPLRSCPPFDASQGLAAGPYGVRVHHISCRQGRRVARAVVRHGKDAMPAWSCTYRRKGFEGSVTTCRRGGRVVRFFTGA